MKKIYIILLCAAMAGTTSFAQSNDNFATFDDLGLAAESYWNGADGTGAFTSGDYTFVNNFTDWGEYGTSWDGFAYATMSSKAYDSLDDQYNCCVGQGADGSQGYAVFFYNSFAARQATITRKDGKPFTAYSARITNSAYAYKSMTEGDDYSKKFDTSDWFMLTITGYLEDEKVGELNYYLAKDGAIIDTWEKVDLSELGTVDRLSFGLSSSDNGEWGMNTPGYFCLDNFNEPLTVDAIDKISRGESSTAVFDLQGRSKTDGRGFMIRNGKVVIVGNR